MNLVGNEDHEYNYTSDLVENYLMKSAKFNVCKINSCTHYIMCFFCVCINMLLERVIQSVGHIL